MSPFHFEHQAMATQFYLSISGESAEYAHGAAVQCFQRLDELERMLSRFIADSDISRINRSKAGDQVLLDHETWQVLKQAIQVQLWTQGAFDIGIAEHMKIFQASKQGILNTYEMTNALATAQVQKQQASIYLHPQAPILACINEGMQIDLGGIGKGYALDQLALLLQELDIVNYFISAGDSTILTRGRRQEDSNWHMNVAASSVQHSLVLENISVSASGTFHQGGHIFDPRTGKNANISEYDRLWVACTNAAYADALSTGLFLLSPDELEQTRTDIPEIIWVAYSKDGKIHFLPEKNVHLKEVASSS